MSLTKEELRNRTRDSLFLLASMKLIESGKTFQIRVRNLSTGGMMAEGCEGAKRGDLIEVELRNIGKVRARIAWVDDFRFGVAFDHPVDPMLARKPVGQGEKAPKFARPMVSTPRRMH